MTSVLEAFKLSEKSVRTTTGCIRGRRCESIYGDKYFSFERIPFAEPPLGELRFKPPVPKKPWFNLLDCTVKSEKPLQHNWNTNIVEGSEDCLYLNVYVKEFGTQKPFPVMVYLYGGGFEQGDPTRDRHGPDYFMSRKVVIVTIGYRVGALGFISFEDPSLDCPGNAGLKDQLLGLKWVKANASRFNGDPENITLFGCSAGAASVHYLTMTPLAKGLFHKVILQSGTALSPWALSNLKCLPHRLAKKLGYKGPPKDEDVFKYLQKADGKMIIQTNTLNPKEQLQGHLYQFGPVVEPYKSSHCIIPYNPEILIYKSWGHKIPMMIGGCSFEGHFLKLRFQRNPAFLRLCQTSPIYLLPNNLREQFSKTKQVRVAKLLKELHFGEEDITGESVERFCEYVTYQQFWHPIHRTILLRRSFYYAPTFVYRFDFVSRCHNINWIEGCGRSPYGANHCDDMAYLFHTAKSPKLSMESIEYQNIQRMLTLWTKFAKHSNPNSKRLTKCEWKPLEQKYDEPILCLNINIDLRIVKLPESEKLSVWESLYKETYDYDNE